VTCHTQPCRPCEITYTLHYIPQGDDSSPRGSWGICAPSLPEVLTDFAATVELYSTYIKQRKADNSQLIVSEVSFAREKAGTNSYGKRQSTGILNVSNANVDDRFFDKHEYNALTTDEKNTFMLNRLKRGHVEKSHTDLQQQLEKKW
jgi:hypothetical protein